jgi:phospholipase/carboxylesterase
MIVAIHGMGDRPESWIGPWGGLPVKARIIAPRAPRRYGSGFSWFTYPPKSEESAAQEIREAADLVAAGLHAWQEDRPTVGKPIVTGFSQGGFLSFAIAVLHPGDVALAIPMSGGLPRPLVPREPIDAAAFPPIFAVHGDADRLVPISMAREPVQRMRALGMRADLVELPGVDHTMNGEMWTRLHGRVVTELK